MMVRLERVWSARMCLVLGLALTACQLLAEADRVTLANRAKEVLLGKITKDDRDGLEIELSVGKRTLNSSEIADVDWDIGTEGFHEAVTAFRGGSYSHAIDNLQDIVDQKEHMDQVRAVARPYVQYLYAESKYRAGKASEAMAAYQKLIETYPKSRYVAFAITNMADSAIQAKAYDKLPPMLALLREGGPEQKQVADYFEGEALLAQNKTAEAQKKYASASTGGTPKARAMALVGQARCYIALNDAARAKETATAALALTPPEATAAIAHNIVGDAILADAESKKLGGTQLQDALLDAILEYMRAQTQYQVTDPRVEGYAVLKTAECFQRLSKLPSRAGNDDHGRATALFSRLTSERRFASTDFPNQAFKHLDEMK